ncbi:DUF262 domain-containing protein [Parvibaculum sp.]|uniref:DUF262 domain-containing protein n=1 Tax=Parvibaculum sp. TaxID=2024848 RepID=UPI003210D629
MKLASWEPDIRTAVNWVENGEIDLQPDFQRGDIWPYTKKRRLIDTILREWSIPPLHVVVNSEGRLEVLDGQQRLTAIRDFVAGEFSIDGQIEPRDPYIEALGGLRYDELPPLVRRKFDQYVLRIFRITDFKPSEPGELFYRLNQPSSLTAGEQRNALYGPARQQLKALVQFFSDQLNDQSSLGFSNVRMAYDDVLAKLLYFIESGSFSVKAKEALISERFKIPKFFAEDVIRRAEQSIRWFSDSRAAAALNSPSVRLRFNKATLLSWLLFFLRFGESRPDINFLGRFETARQINDDQFPVDLLRLFSDRASLRVSDVTSVVYRDVALWAAYSHCGHRPLVGAKILPTLLNTEEGAHRELEEMFGSEINVEAWGALTQ